MVYKSNGDILYPSNGEWIIDNYSGILTFYGTLPSGISTTNLPKITFYRYIGKKGFNTTHTSDGKVGCWRVLTLSISSSLGRLKLSSIIFFGLNF